MSPAEYLQSAGLLTEILLRLTSSSQPVNHDLGPSVHTQPLLSALHHQQVCWDVCACDNGSGLGMGVAGTFSMMTSFSGINGVAQQLHVESLAQLAVRLMLLAFPPAEMWGATFHMPCTPWTHPLCKHSNTMLASIMSYNDGYTFSAGCHTAVDMTSYPTLASPCTLKMGSRHTFLENLIAIIRFKRRLPSKTADRKRIPRAPWNQPIMLNSGPSVAHGIDCCL